jgi:hypothetical protein
MTPCVRGGTKTTNSTEGISLMIYARPRHGVTCVDSLLAIIAWKGSRRLGHCWGWRSLVLGSWCTTATLRGFSYILLTCACALSRPGVRFDYDAIMTRMGKLDFG